MIKSDAIPRAPNNDFRALPATVWNQFNTSGTQAAEEEEEGEGEDEEEEEEDEWANRKTSVRPRPRPRAEVCCVAVRCVACCSDVASRRRPS